MAIRNIKQDDKTIDDVILTNHEQEARINLLEKQLVDVTESFEVRILELEAFYKNIVKISTSLEKEYNDFLGHMKTSWTKKKETSDSITENKRIKNLKN